MLTVGVLGAILAAVGGALGTQLGQRNLLEVIINEVAGLQLDKLNISFRMIDVCDGNSFPPEHGPAM